MSKRKTTFQCGMGKGDQNANHNIEIKIIGSSPKQKPYVAIYARTSILTTEATGWVEDKDLELFAVNILKALNSKKLKSYSDKKPVHRKIKSF